MPPPPQMAIMPYLDWRLLISLSSVMSILAPVAPNGWPQGNHVAVHPARAGTPTVVKAVAVILTESASAPCDG